MLKSCNKSIFLALKEIGLICIRNVLPLFLAIILVTGLAVNQIAYAASGDFIQSITDANGAGGTFNTPTGVAVDSADRIIVSDNNNNRIQIFGGFSPPPAPTGLIAYSISDSAISLNWTAPTGTITGYFIESESPIGDGLLPDQHFINQVKWLIENGIIIIQK